MKITATINAYITGSHLTLKVLSSMSPERAVSSLAMHAPFEYGEPEGWVKVGTAEVTVTFDDPEKITKTQIAMLRAAQKKVKADCEVALNQIEGQIQSLLAIESK